MIIIIIIYFDQKYQLAFLCFLSLKKNTPTL